MNEYTIYCNRNKKERNENENEKMEILDTIVSIKRSLNSDVIRNTKSDDGDDVVVGIYCNTNKKERKEKENEKMEVIDTIVSTKSSLNSDVIRNTKSGDGDDDDDDDDDDVVVGNGNYMIRDNDNEGIDTATNNLDNLGDGCSSKDKDSGELETERKEIESKLKSENEESSSSPIMAQKNEIQNTIIEIGSEIGSGSGLGSGELMANEFVEDAEYKKSRAKFNQVLFDFMEKQGTRIDKIPTFDHKELDFYKLHKGVISRGGLSNVVANKLWPQITHELCIDPVRTDAGFRLRVHYLKYLYPFEKEFFNTEKYEEVPEDIQDDVSSENDELIDNPSEVPKTKKGSSHVTANSPEGSQYSLRRPSKKKARQKKSKRRTKKKESVNDNSISTSSSKVSKSRNRPVGVTKRTKKSKKNKAQKFASIKFMKLERKTLQKYRQAFKLPVSSGASKKELAGAIVLHFSKLEVDEHETIRLFFSNLKSLI